jgi:hypothetical protein
MVIYIIKWTFIYVALIFLLHNLYLFFQNNLTSTIIKDYYNTYNNNINNSYNIKTTKSSFLENKLQIGSTGLEELNKYNNISNYNNGSTNYGSSNYGISNYELTNNELTNNELTNDMKSELNDFFNKLKL